MIYNKLGADTSTKVNKRKRPKYVLKPMRTTRTASRERHQLMANDDDNDAIATTTSAVDDEFDTRDLQAAADKKAPVRQSRRIAQIKIREEADRCETVEIAQQIMEEALETEKDGVAKKQSASGEDLSNLSKGPLSAMELSSSSAAEAATASLSIDEPHSPLSISGNNSILDEVVTSKRTKVIDENDTDAMTTNVDDVFYDYFEDNGMDDLSQPIRDPSSSPRSLSSATPATASSLVATIEDEMQWSREEDKFLLQQIKADSDFVSNKGFFNEFTGKFPNRTEENVLHRIDFLKAFIIKLLNETSTKTDPPTLSEIKPGFLFLFCEREKNTF